MRGLERVCDEHGVAYAAVVFAYGSLSRASFKRLQRPPGSDHPTLSPLAVDGRVEFMAGQGLVCRATDGSRETHLHGTISDEEGRVLGGHFVADENPVFNNMDFVLQELLGVRLTRAFDEETATVEMIVEGDVETAAEPTAASATPAAATPAPATPEATPPIPLPDGFQPDQGRDRPG